MKEKIGLVMDNLVIVIIAMLASWGVSLIMDWLLGFNTIMAVFVFSVLIFVMIGLLVFIIGGFIAIIRAIAE